MPASVRFDLDSRSGHRPAPRVRTSGLSFLAELARATIARQQRALGTFVGTPWSRGADGAATERVAALRPGTSSEQQDEPTLETERSNALQPTGKQAHDGDKSPSMPPLWKEHWQEPSGPAQEPSDAHAQGSTASPLSSFTKVTVTPDTAPAGPLPGVASVDGKLPNGIPWRLEDYPRPPGDTGRSFHWIPTIQSDPATVDRFVREAKQMGASWMVILNDGTNIGNNDYLVRRLVENGIEPIMRIYTHRGEPITGDLVGMVRHYTALGVRYFQPYNEPNLPEENPDGRVSVASYVDRWIPAARAILEGGGLPGLGALAPGAPVDDVAFLRSTLRQLRSRGETDLLDRAWISMHNYTFNRPIDYQEDSNGFLKFRWYDRLVRQELGRSLPIIGTEGGPRLGDRIDPRFPPVDENRRNQLTLDTFRYLERREPYLFAHTQWVLANEAGGGHDPSWRDHALFRPDGSPTVLAQMLRVSEVNS